MDSVSQELVLELKNINKRFHDGELDTLAGRQANVGLVALANHEDVGSPCRERLGGAILDM